MKKNNQLIFVAIFTIVTILIWIGADLYHISVNSTIPEDMKQIVIPINPTLDTKIFEELRSKKDPADFISGTEVSSISSPSAEIQVVPPTPTTAPISTNSGVTE
jgi:hypothetical protein